jgi:hypothetical protein
LRPRCHAEHNSRRFVNSIGGKYGGGRHDAICSINEGKTLADLKASALPWAPRVADRDWVCARYVTELLGVDADREQAIRWLIVMALCAIRRRSH